MPITAAVPATCRPFHPHQALAARGFRVSGPSQPAVTAAPMDCSSAEPKPLTTSACTSVGSQTVPNKGGNHRKPSTRAKPISGLASAKTRQAMLPVFPYLVAHPGRRHSPLQYPDATSEKQKARLAVQPVWRRGPKRTTSHTRESQTPTYPKRSPAAKAVMRSTSCFCLKEVFSLAP